RDVDIVAGNRAETTSSTTTATATEAAVNTWNDELITSVVRVDASSGETALGSALTGAPGRVVVLNGDLHDVTDRLLVGASTTLLGGGTVLRIKGATSGVEVDYTTDGATGSIKGGVTT